MQTIEHIIVVILFIIVVIQTIRSSYFKINYKVLEQLNEHHLEKIKDSEKESDNFEKANMYLREKIQTLKRQITIKINRLNYLETRIKELESLNAAISSLNTALDEQKILQKIDEDEDQYNTTAEDNEEDVQKENMNRFNKSSIRKVSYRDYVNNIPITSHFRGCQCRKCINFRKDSNEA